MAGDWIGLDHELAESEHVLGIFERTNTEIGTIIGRMFLLWRWFDKMTVDGHIPRVGLRSVSAQCGGDPPFWQAVVDVGWLVVTDDGVEMPDFEKRIGKSARARMKESRRKKDYEATRYDRPTTKEPEQDRGNSAETARKQRGPASTKARQLSESESIPEQQPPSLNQKSNITSSSKPITDAPVIPAMDSEAKAWEEVEEELNLMKVALKAKAIESARANGCTPKQVIGWLAWLNSRPGMYSKPSGVIFNRMTTPDAAGWAVDEHWPDATGAVEGGPEPDRYKSPAKTAQQIADDEAEVRRKREKFLETERLNAPFQGVLDAMNDDELDELVGSHKLVRSQLRGKGRDSPDVRLLLLKLLREREAVPA